MFEVSLTKPAREAKSRITYFDGFAYPPSAYVSPSSSGQVAKMISTFLAEIVPKTRHLCDHSFTSGGGGEIG